MIVKEQVWEALKHLEDPVYRRNIMELHLIRDVMIKENRVSLTALLTIDHENRRAELQQEITKAVKAIGAEEVHIRFRAISEYERGEVAKQLEDAQAVREQGKPNSSVLDPEAGVEFIAVASGKGGVGKSTVTVNLAVALARQGKKVGIIDADIYGFSVPDMMGIETRPVLDGDRIIPVERFGVKVISMGFFVEDNAPIIWRGPMLGKMLRNFFAEVEWGDVEYILLDLPPGTGDVALDVHSMIPQSKEIIVTTPHATAAFVAARAGAMALRTEHEILGVVENMAYYECGSCGTKEYVFGRGGGGKLAESLHTELLAQIPLGAPDNPLTDPEFAPSIYKSDTATGQIYDQLAQRIIN
ncbi:ATP-binding protein [Paenibacillus swuensis]|uniref:Iron-sulfur cluster carrier protein n=1 Tax=Paenibacillus swuensis TaxID=1178515 RepID=A0A172TIY2_9BACL|nr:P-loop NTPase [Paenibacillus swuensis]ANE46817.1 ATP-binding protein [Paenibacillus swuensis]